MKRVRSALRRLAPMRVHWPGGRIAEAEARVRLVLAALPGTLVALCDRDLRCVLLDGPLVDDLGLDPGRPIAETMPREQFETLALPLRAALAGEPRVTEWTSAASGVTYEFDVAPYRSADGAIAGALVLARDVTARRARERESARILAEAQKLAHIGSWELDVGAGRLVWSEELCRIFGRVAGLCPTVGEFMAMVHPDDRHILEREVAEAVDGVDGASEYRIVRPDGEIRHVSTVRSPRRDPRGRITHLVGSTQDITDRVERELRLRELASVVEHSAEAITSKDAQGRITGWNAGAERLYGYTAEEAIGAPISMLIPPDRAGEDQVLLARALADGTTVQHETVRVRQDGSRVEVSITVSPLRDHQGKPVGASVITRDISPRKQLERELTSLFDHAPAALVLRDLDGRYLRVNRFAAQALGATPEELVGMDSTEFAGTRSLEQIRAEIARSGQATNEDFTIAQADGPHDYHLVRYPVLDSAGEVTGFGSFALDITDRRRTERERERALRDMAEAQAIAHIGSWTWDVERDRATWSAEMYRLFGRDPGEGPAAGEHFFAYLHPDDRARVAAGYAESFGGGRAFELDYRIVAGDGTERVLHAHGRQEAPGHYAGTVQDVTELRAIERALARSEAFFRNTVANAPIGIALVAPDGRFLTVNRALCEIVGYGESELLALTFQDITHPDDLAADLEYVRQVLAGEIATYRMEKRYLHRDGSVVWIELSVSLVRDERDEPLHFIAQIQDVTAARRARDALVASEQRYHSIAANVPGMVYRFAIAPDGTPSLRFASGGSRDLYGLEPEVVMSDPGLIIDRVHPDDRAAWRASVAESMATLSRWEWSGRHLTPDGGLKYTHATAQPFREPDGTVVWDGVVSDETEVRLARAQESDTRQRLQAILENLAGSAVSVYDRDHRLRFIEGPLFAHLDAETLVGRSLDELAGPDTVALMGPALERALDGESVAAVLDEDRDGRTLAIHFAPYRMAAGTIEGALVHWHDITPVRRAEHERDEALERFQVAFERAPIGMVIVRPDGRFERVNAALCEITGYTAEDLVAMAPFAIVHPEDSERVAREFSLLGEGADTITIEHRIAHATGQPTWVQGRVTLIRDDAGRPDHALAQILDITERRNYEERLRHMADHDPLTGLLNRRGFEASLEDHLARCRRYGNTGALLVLDLDGFKMVNDTLGHAAGDELIINCAHALKGRLRETDTVARLGGDEFAVLLPTQTQSEAEHVAQALVETVRERAATIADAHPGRVTVSIGIAPFSDGTLTADEILVSADLAMYEAKEAGKDRYALYSHDGHVVPRVKAQMTWLERIEHALAEERFALHAQPIIDLSSGETVRHEILVRMLDEHGDLIPPSTFLYIAERFGIIRELDRWIVTQAIRAMAGQRAKGHSLPLAVNLSGLSTAETDILDTISRELRHGHVPATDLTLEITETAAVADIPRARRFADALKDIGCQFALDDFGAGFGSFYYLKHLPFDTVKIDGEFVRHATENTADRLVIKAVAEIARGLGKKTVAEFVPDEPTIRLLLRHGVDHAQGYYLGRPRPLDELTAGRAAERRTTPPAR